MWQFLSGIAVGFAVVIVILISKMIAKNKDTIEDNNQYIKQLEELSKLTGGLAHEIKNPLSTIKINLRLITEDFSSSGSNPPQSCDEKSLARALKKIAVIQKETDRLEQILDGFLRYVGRTELQLASLDINPLLNDMIDFYSPQAHAHSITIRVSLCDKPLICRVDADMLKQVILNLLINSSQAMNEGGELIIRTDSLNNFAVISVSDTGVGIEPDKLDKIFDAYYSSRQQGSGLGLPIAKKIVEQHNGTITVDSVPGKGACFTIKLPILQQ